jgi:hypothetical protein
MTRGFRRTRHGPAARFEAEEADVLRAMFTDMLGLLDDPDTDPVAARDQDPLAALTGLSDAGTSTAPTIPGDPVLARLFPDAYGDDVARSSEFRRFTESELRTGKVAAVRAVLESIDTVDRGLDAATADAWLTALNDLRLAVGTRLEVTEETYLDPDVPGLAVYSWLGFLQETLVESVR